MKWAIALTLFGLAAAAASARGTASPKKKTPHAGPVLSGKKAAVKSSHAQIQGAAVAGKSHRALASAKVADPKTSRKRWGRYAKRGRVVRAAPVPSYQTHPDPDRYQEIQKALAERGYFKGEPNGVWDNDSVDALKAFQANQNLDMDGKINARSLLGLGLGPKHEGNTASALASPAPTTPVPAASTAAPQ